MLYAYLFKYIIIGDTGVRARATAVALAQSEMANRAGAAGRLLTPHRTAQRMRSQRLC